MVCCCILSWSSSSSLVLEQVQVLDHSCPTSLRFHLGTFFRPDSVHTQHFCKIRSVGCSVILTVASDKHPVLTRDTGLLWWLMTSNGMCMYATFSTSKTIANSDLMQAYIESLIWFRYWRSPGLVHLWPLIIIIILCVVFASRHCKQICRVEGSHRHGPLLLCFYPAAKLHHGTRSSVHNPARLLATFTQHPELERCCDTQLWVFNIASAYRTVLW